LANRSRYNWFTEGFDTKDLQEAKALLEELKGKGGDVWEGKFPEDADIDEALQEEIRSQRTGDLEESKG